MVLTQVTENKIRVGYKWAHILSHLSFGVTLVSLLLCFIFMYVLEFNTLYFNFNELSLNSNYLLLALPFVFLICSYILFEVQFPKFQQEYSFEIKEKYLIYNSRNYGCIKLDREFITIITKGNEITVKDDYNIVSPIICGKKEDNIKLLEFLTKAQL